MKMARRSQEKCVKTYTEYSFVYFGQFYIFTSLILCQCSQLKSYTMWMYVHCEGFAQYFIF